MKTNRKKIVIISIITAAILILAYSSPTPTSMYRSFKTKLPFLLREEFFYIGYRIARIFR